MWFFSSTHMYLFVPERKHWIATSYRDGEVLLYDGLFSGSLTASAEEQLVQLMYYSAHLLYCLVLLFSFSFMCKFIMSS